jgi:hypothetical protein
MANEKHFGFPEFTGQLVFIFVGREHCENGPVAAAERLDELAKCRDPLFSRAVSSAPAISRVARIMRGSAPIR